MSQQEVSDLLKKKNKWMTVKEISSLSDTNKHNISINLNKLFKNGYVLKKERGSLKGGYLWKTKK